MPTFQKFLSATLRSLALTSMVWGVMFIDAATAFSAPPSRPPNIIFVLADDLGYGDLGCFGQRLIRTPNLDRLAAQGMRLTQHYSGNAVCAPSRCVLMTGKHPGHAIVRDNRGLAGASVRNEIPESEGQFPIPDGTLTMAERLRPLGYRAGGFGKWGLGGPNSPGAPLRQGFDRWFGYNCQAVAHNFYPTYLWDDDRAMRLPNSAFSAHDRLGPDADPRDPASYLRFQGRAYSADLIAEQALRFIRESADQPFFLYWPTTVPHVALQVPDDSLAEYVGKFEDPPYPGGRGYLPHFRPRAAYAAMITRMDREIGRAMDLIEELGLESETIFVFTSDNGPLHGTHEGLAGTDSLFFNSHGGLRDGKGTLYEGGIRVPAIVTWKGHIAPGTVSSRVSGFEDWLPTLLELVGAAGSITPDMDGISMARELLGQPQEPRAFLYREFAGYGGQQSIRVGDWKLIRRGLSPRPRGRDSTSASELYELRDDPSESTDMSERHPQVVARLQTLMRANRSPSVDFPIPELDRPAP
jgi:arylsulfatase A